MLSAEAIAKAELAMQSNGAADLPGRAGDGGCHTLLAGWRTDGRRKEHRRIDHAGCQAPDGQRRQEVPIGARIVQGDSLKGKGGGKAGRADDQRLAQSQLCEELGRSFAEPNIARKVTGRKPRTDHSASKPSPVSMNRKAM
jgi:hypothetical protein